MPWNAINQNKLRGNNMLDHIHIHSLLAHAQRAHIHMDLFLFISPLEDDVATVDSIPLQSWSPTPADSCLIWLATVM